MKVKLFITQQLMLHPQQGAETQPCFINANQIVTFSISTPNDPNTQIHEFLHLHPS